VGSGHLTLNNLFGGGRTGELKLDRRPGQVSLFDVAASDPYLFGWPLRLQARFRGEQRDSTYGKRTYRLGVGYRFAGGLEVLGTASREVTRPGQAGAQLQGDRQRIPRAEALFYGLGLRYRNMDRSINPRRGGVVEVNFEQGRKERRFFEVTAASDTTRQEQSLRQERITGSARLYLPLFDRQVLATGLDAQVLLSRSYDRSDLFRIGGAQSLRGYDEDRFLGNAVGRVLAEYRLQIDRVSYAYAFGDLGFVERPELQTGEASRSWHPGYGIGIQFGTALGIVNASYALSPEVPSPANGRIHLGLSVRL
jgi:outer membrane protein assembly factor BamA